MADYSKAVKRKMSELISIAYERELSEHLQALLLKFDDWKNKKICKGSDGIGHSVF